MPQVVLSIARVPALLSRLRQRTDRHRLRDTFGHHRQKPRMTPEAARRDHRQMLRFLAVHAAVGAAIGVVLAAALILLDVGGLGRLLRRAASPVMPRLLVVLPFASLFGAAATASAIVLLPYDRKFRDDD